MPEAKAHRNANFSAIYRAEHQWIRDTKSRLRQQRWLRLHVFLIAVCTLAGLLLGGTALRWLGVETLAWRYALTLPLSYLIYLALLRLWAGYLMGRETYSGDGLDIVVDLPSPNLSGAGFEAGGGGDFAGAGATGDFGGEAGAQLAEGTVKVGADALGSLDEGAVVVLPLLGLLTIAALLAGLLGTGIFMLFGVEVLLAVAVELGLAALAGSFAYRRDRQGWMLQAVGHTWRGALAMLVMGIALGAAIDHWLPDADSLPQAISVLRGKP